MDTASMNPEQLTSTPTKQDLLNEEIQKLAVKTHLEVQQREDIRRDLAERMQFVPPDLRVGERVFYWQEDPSIIQQGRKSGRWLKVGDSCCQRSYGSYQYWCVYFSSYCKQTKKTSGDWIWKNFQIRVSGQQHLCCGFLVKVKLMFGSCFLTISIQVLFLTDKDFWLQPQWTSEPRRLRTSRQCSQKLNCPGVQPFRSKALCSMVAPVPAFVAGSPPSAGNNKRLV